MTLRPVWSSTIDEIGVSVVNGKLDLSAPEAASYPRSAWRVAATTRPSVADLSTAVYASCPSCSAVSEMRCSRPEASASRIGLLGSGLIMLVKEAREGVALRPAPSAARECSALNSWMQRSVPPSHTRKAQLASPVTIYAVASLTAVTAC
eukprot:5334236-Pleurochrysis_carterae.AAC.5